MKWEACNIENNRISACGVACQEFRECKLYITESNITKDMSRWDINPIQTVSGYTFFILWPITPVDSTNTSSGFIFSSCNYENLQRRLSTNTFDMEHYKQYQFNMQWKESKDAYLSKAFHTFYHIMVTCFTLVICNHKNIY